MPSLFLVEKLILQNKTNFDCRLIGYCNLEHWKTWKMKDNRVLIEFWLSFDWVLIEFWLSFDWVLNGLKFRKLVPLFVHLDKAEAPFWEITRVNNKTSVSRWDQFSRHRRVLDLGKFSLLKDTKRGLELIITKYLGPTEL